MVGLTILMHFQQFENLKFLNFFPGEHAPGPPKSPCRVSKHPELGGIVPILLENPESRLNFSRDMSIPILNNSSHKPTSREIYFGKILTIFVIAYLGYPGDIPTKSNHITMLVCSVGGLFNFPAFPNQTFCC